jgi:hypothetical protein
MTTIEEKIKMFGLKQLKVDELKFEANGKTYHIINTLSLGRAIQFDRYIPELKAGASLSDFHNVLTQIREYQNSLKFVEASVLLDNLQNAVELKSRDMPTFLKICSLFMCYDGEDAKEQVSEELLYEKVDDWITEGYTQDGFFYLAVTLANGLSEKLEK